MHHNPQSQKCHEVQHARFLKNPKICRELPNLEQELPLNFILFYYLWLSWDGCMLPEMGIEGSRFGDMVMESC